MDTSRKQLGVPILIAFLVGVCHASKKDYVYENAQYRVYRDTSLSVESYDTAAVSTASIVRHLDLINALLEIVDQPGCPCVVADFRRQKFPVDVEMRLMRSFPDTNYICRGQWSIDVGRHGFINSFVMSGPCARDTSYKANYPMGCAIDSSGKAVEVARTFLGKLLKVNGVSDDVAGYDSVFVKEEKKTYTVKLIGTNKRDIIDTRWARIRVMKRSGLVDRLYGELYSELDLTYTPSVSKERAIALLQAALDKADDPPPYLHKVSIDKYLGRWGWRFALCREKTCSDGTIVLYVDSENGDILMSEID
jgi:hypothetical protein